MQYSCYWKVMWKQKVSENSLMKPWKNKPPVQLVIFPNLSFWSNVSKWCVHFKKVTSHSIIDTPLLSLQLKERFSACPSRAVPQACLRGGNSAVAADYRVVSAWPKTIQHCFTEQRHTWKKWQPKSSFIFSKVWPTFQNLPSQRP